YFASPGGDAGDPRRLPRQTGEEGSLGQLDLGIEGRRAIVCASSRGLGFACARALASEGVHVVINGRDEARLAEAAELLANETGRTVTAIAGDVTTVDGRAALLAACPEPDILINN